MAETRGTKLAIHGLDKRQAELIHSRIMEAAYSSMIEIAGEDKEFGFGLGFGPFSLSFDLDWPFEGPAVQVQGKSLEASTGQLQGKAQGKSGG
jgi:hypothetical protein